MDKAKALDQLWKVAHRGSGGYNDQVEFYVSTTSDKLIGIANTMAEAQKIVNEHNQTIIEIWREN